MAAFPPLSYYVDAGSFLDEPPAFAAVFDWPHVVVMIVVRAGAKRCTV